MSSRAASRNDGIAAAVAPDRRNALPSLAWAIARPARSRVTSLRACAVMTQSPSCSAASAFRNQAVAFPGSRATASPSAANASSTRPRRNSNCPARVRDAASSGAARATRRNNSTASSRRPSAVQSSAKANSCPGGISRWIMILGARTGLGTAHAI